MSISAASPSSGLIESRAPRILGDMTTGTNGAYLMLSGRWHLPGPSRSALGLVTPGPQLSCWWRSMFPQVLELDPGEETGRGRILRLENRTWLPFGLLWHLRIESVEPEGFGFSAWGDVEGEGRWRLEPGLDGNDLLYDWRLRLNKPRPRWLAGLMRPLLARRLQRLFEEGERGLNRELRGDEPGAETPATSGLNVVPLLGAALLAILLLRRRRR
jgi:MYXO-CTERM domain-containing protein